MKKFLILVAIVATTFVASDVWAQPDPPAGGSPPCGGPFGPVCPIDGGVSFLIGAGLLYGGKKAYDIGRRK
ncbi:MAG: hypothetical protein RL220_63 [Bacteroidota bacterium]